MTNTPRMKWASASSRLDLPAAAASEVARELRAQLGDAPPDLLLAFVSGPGPARTSATADMLRAEYPAATFAVASSRGVVTSEHEIEQGVAVSVIAARLPGVGVKPFLLTQDVWAEPVDSETDFDLRAPGVRGAELVLLVGDPFSLQPESNPLKRWYGKARRLFDPMYGR
ncbi:MAG: hypothetical protein ABL977_11335 [Candidatus Eisenbacteria bacterium]